MERLMVSRSAHKPAPLAIPFTEACASNGHGRDKGYTKIKGGRWESYMDGGTRMVVYESMKRDQARMLAERDAKFDRAPMRGQSEEAFT
jgi:hypothetical protein